MKEKPPRPKTVNVKLVEPTSKTNNEFAAHPSPVLMTSDPNAAVSYYEKLLDSHANYYRSDETNGDEFVTIEDPLAAVDLNGYHGTSSGEIPFDIWANSATQNGNNKYIF